MSAVTINRCSYVNKSCYMRETLTGVSYLSELSKVSGATHHKVVSGSNNVSVQTIRRKDYCVVITEICVITNQLTRTMVTT